MDALPTAYPAAYAELADAETVADKKVVGDKAAAVRGYMAAAADVVGFNLATETMLVAQRVAGRQLIDMAARGERKVKGKGGDPTIGPIVGLAELDITQNQSTRWQVLARLSEAEFKAHVETCQATVSEGKVKFPRGITKRPVAKPKRPFAKPTSATATVARSAAALSPPLDLKAQIEAAVSAATAKLRAEHAATAAALEGQAIAASLEARREGYAVGLKAGADSAAAEIARLTKALQDKVPQPVRAKAPVFTVSEINVLRKALHPDGKPAALADMFTAASALFNDRADLLLMAAKWRRAK
jgi:hypothetical protein